MKTTAEVIGTWNETKGKLKRTFAMLADDNLNDGGRKQDEMLERLQAKLGKTKEEIYKLIAEL